jgi:hypothetical protein
MGIRTPAGLFGASCERRVRTTALALRAQATGAESAFGRHPFQMGDPYWLGMSAVSSTSFTATGMPCYGPVPTDAVAARIWPGSKCSNARTLGLRIAM